MSAVEKLVSGPEQRRTAGGIGASEAAAAIGVSDYQTPVDAWLVATGRAPGFAGNEQTEWGHILEPVIRAKYVEKNRVEVYVPPESIWHPAIPWLKATPDGIVLDATGAWLHVGPQVKNVGLRMASAWAEGVPTDYLIQGVVEMSVTDLPRIDFAVLMGGQQYREFTVYRDAELEADVLEGLHAFWRLVETDAQPAIDESAKLKSHLLGQIKRCTTIEAGPLETATISRWREVVVEMARLKKEERRIKNLILASLAAADAGRMTSELGAISIGNPRKKTAWKDVAHALRPLLTTASVLERELAALRADAEDSPALMQRIDGLRAQLRLVGDLNNFEALVATNTKVGEPSVNRPRNWTKDIGPDSEEAEED